MARFLHWLVLATMCLGASTTLVGITALISASETTQSAFLGLSGIMLISLLTCLVLFILAGAPPHSFRRLAWGTMPFAILWALLLLPRERISDENMVRVQMHNHCKEMGLAMESFDEGNGHLPQNIQDEKGTALLSWRVSIAPYVDGQLIYSAFDLSQPWDAPRNRPLLEKMPMSYPANMMTLRKEGHTPWQGFVGKGTAFAADGPPLSMRHDFPDGGSNTILVAEAHQQVPWSKPEDMTYDASKPLPALGEDYWKKATAPFPGYVRDRGFFAVMADGSVRFNSADVPEEILRAMIVRNDVRP